MDGKGCTLQTRTQQTVLTDGRNPYVSVYTTQSRPDSVWRHSRSNAPSRNTTQPKRAWRPRSRNSRSRAKTSKPEAPCSQRRATRQSAYHPGSAAPRHDQATGGPPSTARARQPVAKAARDTRSGRRRTSPAVSAPRPSKTPSQRTPATRRRPLPERPHPLLLPRARLLTSSFYVLTSSPPPSTSSPPPPSTSLPPQRPHRLLSAGTWRRGGAGTRMRSAGRKLRSEGSAAPCRPSGAVRDAQPQFRGHGRACGIPQVLKFKPNGAKYPRLYPNLVKGRLIGNPIERNECSYELYNVHQNSLRTIHQ